MEENRKKKALVIPTHIKIISGEDEPIFYECTCCLKKFKTKLNISYHEFCPDGKKKPFKCEACGNGFITRTHYEYHLRTHTGELPFSCSICSRKFNQKAKLSRHMNSHSEDEPHKCIQCNKTFRLKWKLDLHEKIHSSTKYPFQCEDCSLGFTNKKDLRRHRLIHSCERPYTCNVCGSAFRRKDNFYRHLKNVHERGNSNISTDNAVGVDINVNIQESSGMRDEALQLFPPPTVNHSNDDTTELKTLGTSDNVTHWVSSTLTDENYLEAAGLGEGEQDLLAELADDAGVELEALENCEFQEIQHHPEPCTYFYDIEQLAVRTFTSSTNDDYPACSQEVVVPTLTQVEGIISRGTEKENNSEFQGLLDAITFDVDSDGFLL